MFYSNLIYNFLLERKSSSEITFIPENLWIGNPDNGKKIVEGFLSFYGETIVFDKKVWKKMLLVISGMRSYIALNGLKMLKHWEQIKQEYLLEIIFENG